MVSNYERKRRKQKRRKEEKSIVCWSRVRDGQVEPEEEKVVVMEAEVGIRKEERWAERRRKQEKEWTQTVSYSFAREWGPLLSITCVWLSECVYTLLANTWTNWPFCSSFPRPKGESGKKGWGSEEEAERERESERKNKRMLVTKL